MRPGRRSTVRLRCPMTCFISLAVLFGGCDAEGGKPAPGDTGPAPVGAGIAGLAELGVRNVIVVHVDTLRRDRLVHYGAERETTPRLAARPALVVEGLTTTAGWTIPSTISVLTGLDVQRHGVTYMTSEGRVNSALDSPPLAQWFTDAGLATLLISGNEAITGVDNLEAGFETAPSRSPGGVGGDLAALGDDALAWIDGIDGRPFFVFLQPMDTHGPMRNSEFVGTWSDPTALPFEFGDSEEEQVAAFSEAYRTASSAEERVALLENLRALYDEQILSLDAGLDGLLAGLDSRGLTDDTLVVLAADHGESFGDEPGPEIPQIGHGSTVRQELVQAPLIFLHPRLPSDNRVACLSQNTDLLPTVASVLGLAAMPDIDGRPIQDGCRSTVYASTFEYAVDAPRIVELLASDGSSALRFDCHRGDTYRYDLTSDPGGTVSLAEADFPAEAALAAEVRGLYAEFVTLVGADGCTLE